MEKSQRKRQQQKKEERQKVLNRRKLDLFKKRHVFVCKICLYKTNRSSNLKRHHDVMHISMHEPEECCDILFTTKSELQKHIRSTHQDGYACKYPDCRKIFERRALLKRHYCVHTGEKRFVCGTCDYKTSHKSNLSRHCEIKRHTSSHLNDDGSQACSEENSSREETSSPDDSHEQSPGRQSFVEGIEQRPSVPVAINVAPKPKMKSVWSKKHLMETNTDDQKTTNIPLSASPTQPSVIHNPAAKAPFSTGWTQFTPPVLPMLRTNPYYPRPIAPASHTLASAPAQPITENNKSPSNAEESDTKPFAYPYNMIDQAGHLSRPITFFPYPILKQEITENRADESVTTEMRNLKLTEIAESPTDSDSNAERMRTAQTMIAMACSSSAPPRPTTAASYPTHPAFRNGQENNDFRTYTDLSCPRFQYYTECNGLPMHPRVIPIGYCVPPAHSNFNFYPILPIGMNRF